MNRLAVITGGTKGIGLAISDLLCRSGFTIVQISRRPPDIAHDFSSSFYSCDVRDESSVKSTFEAIKRDQGALSVLINAAGLSVDGLLMKASSDSIADQINTNLVGCLNTCKHAARYLLTHKQSTIINIGSIAGEKGNRGQVAYSASKAGLVGLTKSLAKELGSRGVRVNLIVPGFIETDMTTSLPDRATVTSAIPLKRFGHPHEVAQLALLLIKSTYVTGQVVHIDGGLGINM